MCKLSVKQSKEINELQATVKHCKPFNQGQLLWKIEKFAACLETAKEISGYEIHSPPFYTDQYGYKFMIVAFPNGNGSGEGTHLSLYVRLLVGEYDSLLKWPFLGDITLTLIEQSPDASKQRHISQNFSPDPKWTSFHRPKNSSNTPGFGYPQFAAHETLRTRKYIVDDAIFIRATVELPQIIEAWAHELLCSSLVTWAQQFCAWACKFVETAVFCHGELSQRNFQKFGAAVLSLEPASFWNSGFLDLSTDLYNIKWIYWTKNFWNTCMISLFSFFKVFSNIYMQIYTVKMYYANEVLFKDGIVYM